MNNTIGILLTECKKRRLALGMTQKDVAGRCNLRQSNYSRMESGKQLPTLETLITILDVLGLDIKLTPTDYITYHIMYKNEIVTIVKLSRDKKDIEFNKIKEDGIMQPFSGNQLNLTRFYRFIKSRCYEDGRADLDIILKKAHLKDNNPYDFIKISHGVTYSDDFWIKTEDEKITWEDVKIR